MNYTVMVAATILLLTGATVAVAFSDWQHEFYWRRERDTAYFASGRARRSGDLTSALTHLTRALSYERKLPEDGLMQLMIHIERTEVLALQKKYRDAIAEADITAGKLDDVLTRMPKDLENTGATLSRSYLDLLLKRADYLIRCGEYKEALIALGRADEFVIQNYKRFNGVMVLPLVKKSAHMQSLLYKKLGDADLAQLYAQREEQLDSFDGAEQWAKNHKLVLSFNDANPDLKISEVLLLVKKAIDKGEVEKAGRLMNDAMRKNLYASASWSWQQKFCREAVNVATNSRSKDFRDRCLHESWKLVQKSQTNKLSPWQLEMRDRLIRLAREEQCLPLLREMLASFAQLLKGTDTSTVLLPDLKQMFEPNIAALLDTGQWAGHMEDLRKIDDALRSVGVKLDMCEIAYIRNLYDTNEFIRADARLRKLMQLKNPTDALRLRIEFETMACARRWRDRKQPEVGEALLADAEKLMYAGREVPIALLLCKADLKNVLHKQKEYDAIVRRVAALSKDPKRKDRAEAFDFMTDIYFCTREYDKAEALYRARVASLNPLMKVYYYQWFAGAHKAYSSLTPCPKEGFPYRIMHDALAYVGKQCGVNSASYIDVCYYVGAFDYFNKDRHQDLTLALAELRNADKMLDSNPNRIPCLLLLGEVQRQLGDLDGARVCDERIEKVLPTCNPQTWFGLRCLLDASFEPRNHHLHERCAALMERTYERYME